MHTRFISLSCRNFKDTLAKVRDGAAEPVDDKKAQKAAQRRARRMGVGKGGKYE